MQEIDLAKVLKRNIKMLIEKGELEQARQLLDEYKKQAQDDVEVYSIMAVIDMIGGNMDEAELILKEGLSKYNDNVDLLYNLGYLYEVTNNSVEAVVAYKLAKLLNKGEELKNTIDDKLSEIAAIKNKYNVILVGEYGSCKEIEENFNEWNIVAICNNPQELSKYDYDFIFIAEDLDREVIYRRFQKYTRKNIYFIKDFATSIIEGLDYRFSKLLGEKDIDGIIMGLSYAEVGINEDLLLHNFMNFSFSSQDLYYDFALFKYLFNFKSINSTLKYVIINLGYYSFDYDMTKTVSKYRIHRYSQYFEKYHNNEDAIGIDITRAFYEKRITFHEYLNMNKFKQNSILSHGDINGIYTAQRNSSMDYKETREENKIILDKYLSFLKENKIKPIITILPTSSGYRQYFDKNKKAAFYNILHDLNRKNNAQIIDYFDSDLFNDEDFWDYSHLNGRGAKKMTEILNNEIKW